MTLRIRTLVINSITILASTVLLYLLAHYLLITNLVGVEQEGVRQDITRFTNALNNFEASMNTTAKDWAEWDDTYQFIQDKNDQYIQSNLMDSSFTGLNLNLMVFMDTQRHIVFAKAVDLVSGKESPVPRSLVDRLQTDFKLTTYDANIPFITGLLALPDTLLLFVSRPILTSNSQGPSRGELIFGRFFDNTVISHLASITQQPVNIFNLTDTALPADVRSVIPKLLNDNPSQVKPLGQSQIAGYALIRDVNKQPALAMRISVPRTIYLQGLRQVNWLVLIFVAAGLFTAWLIYHELDMLILNRLSGITRVISQVSTSGDVSLRVNIRGKDELTSMANAINQMLASIDQSQNKLALAYKELEGHSDALNKEISERKLAEGQLIHNALHDPLTGLPNRSLFMDRLGHAIERFKRHRQEWFAVLFLDIDRFKLVNDSLGHILGDQMIVAVGRRIQDCLRTSDTVARIGGDEFVVLLEDIENIDDAIEIASRILQSMDKPFYLAGNQVTNTISIGIVLSSLEYEQADEVLRDADIAMYRAKALGRARYVIFSSAMREYVTAHIEFEADMRLALERHEFILQYEPIVSLESNSIIGFEALIRWDHPRRGLIRPAEFISLAEENDLIIPMGQWVIHEACQQMHDWNERLALQPPLTINVNLSNKQFSQPDLVDFIERTLQETGLDPHSLRLEITESVIMENTELAIATLNQLRTLGVQIHIDDFGTGYSSLVYLQLLPIDAIKIDRSFVSGPGDANNNREIVETIVRLAHDLDKDAIAEGVETQEQLARMKAMNCEYVQGYLFSQSLDPDEVEQLLEKRNIGENQNICTI